MTDKLTSVKGLLALAAVLLALNLVANLASRPAEPTMLPAILASRADANQAIRLENMFVTTNNSGDTIYIWQPGRFVNDSYESVRVDRYTYRGD